jgi:GcrA cell cycle regulator
MSEQNVATNRRHKPPNWSPWTPERIDELKARWSKGLNARQIARELKHGITRAAVLGKIRRLGIADSTPAVVVQPATQRTARKANKRRTESARPPGPTAITRRLAPTPVPRRLASTAITLWRSRSVPSWVLEAQPYIDDPGVDADIPRAQRRSLPQLNDRVCRWPVGDPSRPGFFFCGAQRFANRPFCAAHCERAYRHDQKGEGK